MAEEVSEHIIRWRTDKAALADTIRDTDALRARVEGVSTDLGELGPASQIGVDGVRNQFVRMREEVDTAETSIESLRQQLLQLGRMEVHPRVIVQGALSGRLSEAERIRGGRETGDSLVGQLRQGLGGGDDGGGGRLGGRVETVGRTLFNLPSLQVGGGLSTDQIGRLLRGAGGGLDAIGASAKDLAVAGPIAAGALVAVGVALAAFNESLEENRRVLQGAVSAQENYYTAIATMTSEQVREQVDQLDRVRSVLEQQRAEQRAALDSAFSQASAQFGDAGARALFASGQFSSLEEALKATEEELQENVQTATRYRQGLEQNAFAANDAAQAANEAAEAEKKLADARRAALFRNAEDAREIVLDNARYNAMTSEQIEQEIQTLRTANDALMAAGNELFNAGDTSEETIAKLESYRAELLKNEDRIERLTEKYKPLIEQREAEERALERVRQAQQDYVDDLERQTDLRLQTSRLRRTGTVEQVDSRLRDIDDEVSALLAESRALRERAATSEVAAQRLRELTDRINNLGEESRRLIEARPDVAMRQLREETEKLDQGLIASIQRLTAAKDERLINLAEELDRGLATLQDTFFEQQRSDQKRASEQLAKFHADERRRVKEHQDNLLQIERNGQLAFETARGERDALAGYRAQQQTRRELEEAQRRFDQQSERRKEDLEDLKESLDDQEKERLRDYQKRYNELIAQHRREVAATHAKYQQDINLQIQAYNIELNNLYTAINREIQLKNQGYAAMLVGAAEWANRMIGIANNLVRSARGQSQVITPDYVYVQDPFAAGFLQRASGGDTPANRLVRVNEEGTESGINRRGQFMIFGDQTYVLDAAKTRRLLDGDTSVLPGGRHASGGAQTIINNVTNKLVLNANGVTGAEVDVRSREQAIRYVGEWLTAMGVA